MGNFFRIISYSLIVYYHLQIIHHLGGQYPWWSMLLGCNHCLHIRKNFCWSKPDVTLIRLMQWTCMTLQNGKHELAKIACRIDAWGWHERITDEQKKSVAPHKSTLKIFSRATKQSCPAGKYYLWTISDNASCCTQKMVRSSLHWIRAIEQAGEVIYSIKDIAATLCHLSHVSE